ncbi:MAG: DsbA family protein [Deltaproteobacteria bacterium]|nr:DsbA family protein [Deltaproteobacteria bacterium]
MAERYPADLALVVKQLPLDFHPQAMGAALGALAAVRQGKGWAMHEKMLANRQALGRPELERYAAEVGLDPERFRRDLDDPALKAQVQADRELAGKLGVRGTPTGFANGRPVRGARPIEEITKVVDAELEAAGKLLAAGTPLGEIYEKRSRANVAAGAKE